MQVHHSKDEMQPCLYESMDNLKGQLYAHMALFQVIHCTEEMTKQTLWDAMHTEQPSIEAVKV